MAEQLRGPFEKLVDSAYYSEHVFEKWVDSCKKYIACQGRYFEKETVTAPPQNFILSSLVIYQNSTVPFVSTQG
jgi:hypothetical protein